jgi:hypothetical protein
MVFEGLLRDVEGTKFGLQNLASDLADINGRKRELAFGAFNN